MLRDYQEQLKSDIITKLATNKSVLGVLATGGGKTRVGAEVAIQYSKILWAAHRNELLDQAQEALIKANHQDFTTYSVFFDAPDEYYDLVILDESHHAPAATINKFINSVKCGKVLGLTATPYRLDRQYLDFEAIVYGASIDELTNKNYLVPADLYSVRGNKVDATNWIIDHKPILGKTILFVLDMVEAEYYRILLEPHFVVDVVSAQSDRPAQLKRFTDGDTDILISCTVLTEGVDLPCTSTVIIARNTTSKGLIKQMVGRALRPFPLKDHCKIIQIVSDKVKSIASHINPRNHYISTHNGKHWNNCRVGVGTL